MNKWQRILTIALVAQLAIGVTVFWPRAVVRSAGQPLLADLTADQVTGLAITDETGNATRLARQGDAWVATEAGAYPADATKIAPVIEKLLALTTARLIAETPQSHAQLQVADDVFVRKIELTQADGSAQTLLIGSAAGGQSVHVRLAGQDQVYIGSGLASWEVDSDLLSWINPVYLSFAASDLISLTLKNANGEFALTQDAQGAWQLAGLASDETLDQTKVTSLVNAVSSLRMTTPLGATEDPAWGLADPAAVATMQIKDADQTRTITLTLGAQDAADQSYVVKSSESDFFVRVASFSLEELVQRDRAGFFTATPTPAATSATGPALPTNTPAP